MRGRFAIGVEIDPENWRAGLLTVILRVTAPLGLLVCIPSVYFALLARLFGVAIVDTIALSVVLSLFYFDRIPFRWRAAGVCLTFYVLGACLLVFVGSISQIYLFGFSIVATLLLGLRAGLYAALLSSATMFVIGTLGHASPEMAVATWNYNFTGWSVITLNFALVNTLLTLAIGAMFTALDKALSREIAAHISLDRERKLLRTLIDALPDIVFTKDTRGQFVNGNPALLALYGFDREEQLVGKTVFDLYPREIAEKYHAEDLQVLAGRPLLNREEQRAHGEGNPQWYLTIKVPLRDAAGAILGLVGISRNTTDRKRLEEQLRESHKMEAIGQLAGGVAHDFNNLLTIITGYSELLLAMPEVGDALSASVKAIRDAGLRAASLTRQLLAFGRQSMLQPKVLDLNAIVTETGKMLGRLIGEDILFTTVLDPKLSRVRVDPSQLDQVLMNLAVNARDAMPRGGRLTIETSNIELSDDYAATHLDCEAGHHVMLAISDTGCGMTPEVKARIFEPFYATKGVGQGTGLGLAMVFGIVQQSGGSIHVYSEPDRGTAFKIYFPAVEEPLSRKDDSAPKNELHGSETILLVEDEEGVRGLVLMSLEMHGYKVLTAKDGMDALGVVQAHPGRIDMLLTDVVMPSMSGPELAQGLRARFPQMKVLFMSGYTGDTVVRHGLLEAEEAFIQKPYTPSALAEKVRLLLDKNSG